MNPRSSARWCALAAAAAGLLYGKQLPIKSYTTADGLASNTIDKIVVDSRGFVWFCTPEGVSRFDGYSFSNYGVSQGLPSADARDMIETRGGQYWIATTRGVARFRPDGAANGKFDVYPLDAVNTLFEDSSGTIWAGTIVGLYRLDPKTERFTPVDIGMPKEARDGAIVRAIIEDRQGNLWVGTSRGVYRHGLDGSIDRFLSWLGASSQWVNSLFEDRQGRIWVGTRGAGLYSLQRSRASGSAFTTKKYTAQERMAALRIRSIVQARDGTLWMATNNGLAELGSGGNTSQFRTHSETEGLNESSIFAVAEDRGGDLWVGSETAGAMRIARNGFTTYDREDGFGALVPVSVFGSRAGESLVLTRNGAQTKLAVSFFDGERFHCLRPDFRPIRLFGWRSGQIALHDRAGEWWFATQDGLCRFPKVSVEDLGRARPKRIYGARDGFPSSEVTSIFEDSRGDIWIVTDSAGKTGLSRWLPATETFRHYTAADLPVPLAADSAFAEDRSGSVWFSASRGLLVRYRQGRFERVAEDAVTSEVNAMHTDRSGRLWVGDDEYGLTRVDNPAADRPSGVRYTTAQGLSSNSIHCITEDRWGRVYVGTGRGLDRIEPATGRIKHYGRPDGLPRGDLLTAHWDGQATLWSQTRYAIARFVPEPDAPDPPGAVRVSALRIRGVSYALSDLGATDLSGITLPAGQNQIEIEFSGLGFRSDDLRYQHILEGADHAWSPATDRRSVNYASLSPGSYRFLVRAANVNGIARSAPAVVSFRILPPIWQRWWFLLSEVAVAGFIIHSLYRYRLARQLQLEQVRLRIATDLHDDIGASLSQIALLSEVAGQQVETGSRLSGPLEQIGADSRQLVDAMSEIVWSINPRRDTLGDLSARMRAFASDVFPARNIAFRFAAPSSETDLKLALDARRQIFLIFKESVNNVVRHAACSEAQIDFTLEPGKLAIRVQDNGKGFDSRQTSEGHGLNSMRERARRLGGDLQIASGEWGTAVILTVPVGRGRPWWRTRFLRK